MIRRAASGHGRRRRVEGRPDLPRPHLPVTDVAELITDSSADEAALDAIRRGGTQVIIADEP